MDLDNHPHKVEQYTIHHWNFIMTNSISLVIVIWQNSTLGNGIGFLSHEKNPGWLGYIGDYTIQLYGGYNKPL